MDVLILQMSNSQSQSSPTVDLSDAQDQGINMNMVHNQVSGDHVDFDVDKGMDMSEDKDDIPLDSKKKKRG